MAETLREADVIPEVIKSIPSPDLGLIVSYENEELNMGATIPRNETTTTIPHLKIQHPPSEESTGDKYTIIMTDPDLFTKNDPTGQVRVSHS